MLNTICFMVEGASCFRTIQQDKHTFVHWLSLYSRDSMRFDVVSENINLNRSHRWLGCRKELLYVQNLMRFQWKWIVHLVNHNKASKSHDKVVKGYSVTRIRTQSSGIFRAVSHVKSKPNMSNQNEFRSRTSKRFKVSREKVIQVSLPFMNRNISLIESAAKRWYIKHWIDKFDSGEIASLNNSWHPRTLITHHRVNWCQKLSSVIESRSDPIIMKNR